MLPEIYARRERTLDEMLLREAKTTKESFSLDWQKYQDVVFYRDKECTQFVAREPWHRKSKPTRRNKYQVINCARYRLVWVD